MTTTETTNSISDALANAITKHAEACERHARLQEQYVAAASAGNDEQAEALEAEMDKAQRLVSRLELRRKSFEQQVSDADEIARAQEAARLKACADEILERAIQRVAALESLAHGLTSHVASLSEDSKAWQEARFFARQAGATPEGFATQDIGALVTRVMDELARSQKRAARICGEMSRVSVFM